MGSGAGMDLGTATFTGHTDASVRHRTGLTSPQRDEAACSQGVIGFDIGRSARGSGSRMHGYLVNAPCKPIGANSKRTDFALAA